MLAADAAFGKSSFLFFGFAQKRGGGGRLVVFIKADHGEIAGIGVLSFACLEILRFNADADFHGGSSDIVNRSFESERFTDENGFAKVNLIDRNRDASRAAVARGAHISDSIRHRKNGSAVNIAGGVRVMGHHQISCFDARLGSFFRF